jgi:hypothetical protein
MADDAVEALHAHDDEENPLTQEQYLAYSDYTPIPSFDTDQAALPTLAGQPYTVGVHYPAVKHKFIEELETILDKIRNLKTDPSLEVTKSNFEKVVENKELIEEHVVDLVKVIGDKSIELQDIFHYLYDRSSWLIDKKNAEIDSLKQQIADLLNQIRKLNEDLQLAKEGSAAQIAEHDAEIKGKLDALNAKLKALLAIGPSVVTSGQSVIGKIRVGSNTSRRAVDPNQKPHFGGTKHNKKYRK